MGFRKPERARHLTLRLSSCVAVACIGGSSKETCPEPCDGSITPPTTVPATETTETTDTTETPTETTPPTQVIDTFVQSGNQRVDVLFVIDNSCSMAYVQERVATSFPPFIVYLGGTEVDYHLGVTSTDLDGTSNGAAGHLRTVEGVKYIDSLTPSPEAVFSTMVQMGTSGSWREQGLGAAYTALEVKRDTINAGFLRDDSALMIVVVSDEQDQTSSDLITPSDFTDWLGDLASARPSVGFDAIVMPSGPEAGTVYMDAAASVGGTVFDIETPDYAPILDALGQQARGLKTEFCPSTPQDPESVEVTVEETPDILQFAFPDDYEGTAGGCIRFLDYVPPPDAIIRIAYPS